MILINEVPIEYYAVPFKLKTYAYAYCDWFKRTFPELWEEYNSFYK